jgi:carbohydrate-selective porin OprB
MADFLANWIAMMKRAIQTLAPKYNSDRMVEEYAQNLLLERTVVAVTLRPSLQFVPKPSSGDSQPC